jgi:hypothetical protein
VCGAAHRQRHLALTRRRAPRPQPALPFAGTAQFIRPWDGSYLLGSAFWTQAHFTQATRAGWFFLDGSASGSWDGAVDDGLSYATLVSPSLDAFSTIAVNVENATAALSFQLVGALATSFAGTALAAWTSNATALFSQGADVLVGADGAFTFALPPRTVLTLTTLRTLRKAEPAVPPRAPFPLPFASDFAAQPRNAPGRFLSDLFGAFEVGTDPLNSRGNVLRQAARGAPRAWLGGSDGAPFTSLPAPGTAFANAAFSVDALVMPADVPATNDASVSACGRVPIWQPANFRRGADRPGVCLNLNASGPWALVEVTLAGARTVLAAGSLGAPAAGAWHTLALSFSDDEVTASIDGAVVATVAPGALHVAAGGFGFGSGFHAAAFDAVRLGAAAGHADRAASSWLYDALPGEALSSNFTGWAGFVLDLRAPGTAGVPVAALGRFRARGNARAHALDVIDAATGASVLSAPATVDFATCATDVLGFCAAAVAPPVVLAAGGRYYVVSREEAGGDAFVAMADAAAATSHAHRDGTTLLSYAGPGTGAVAGKVSRADGAAAWTEEGDIECMYGPLNVYTSAPA